MFFIFSIGYNVSQIHAGREFPDKLPTKYCISKFQFPVNEALKPGLRVFAVVGRFLVHQKGFPTFQQNLFFVKPRLLF